MVGVILFLLFYDLFVGDVSIYIYICILEIFVIILNIEFILNECLFCCMYLKFVLKNKV